MREEEGFRITDRGFRYLAQIRSLPDEEYKGVPEEDHLILLKLEYPGFPLEVSGLEDIVSWESGRRHALSDEVGNIYYKKFTREDIRKILRRLFENGYIEHI